MTIPSDFREFFTLLAGHDVDFVVVGGYALAFHGAPRFTGDMDILVRPDSENAAKVLAALAEFGFRDIGLDTGDFAEPDQVVQLGVPPVRIDILTSIDGVNYSEARSTAVIADFDGASVPIICRDTLVANKRASGRPRDLADLEALGE